MWKGMSPSFINLLAPAQGIGYLMPSTHSFMGPDEKVIEGILKDKVAAVRMNDERISTNWDS